ncbi:unnamed protein product [Rotaria sp. Silwood2]|nr:unnamed protein product [Rotaria sp. Silwood2]CAF2840915.1 unnamed protein product [Rotaria sp. Silwood2]CAF3279445.1 unnamed protein product [Rotaria sp. Silwood2]CAF3380079.1 unnamed protein product [Rotaria sp. Silwood2]CAF3937437.1 unnamed protein product [Rotaria sp. Silwood2]
MMPTRSATKRKRLNDTTTTSKRFKTSRSTSNKRSQSKSQLVTHSSIPVNENIYMDNDESFEKDSVINCPDKSPHDRTSTPTKMVVSNSKEINIEKGPLNSTTIPKDSVTTQNQLDTEAVYKQLEDVISSCTPIVGRISSTNSRKMSSIINNDGSVVLDAKDDENVPPPSSSHATPVTNRTDRCHSSQVNRSKPFADQYCSPSTITRTPVNQWVTNTFYYPFMNIPLIFSSNRSSSNHVISSNYTAGSGIRYSGKNGLTTVNRVLQGTPKNIVRCSVNAQSGSAQGGTTGHSTIPSSSTNMTLLQSIPEYRALKKELDRERQRCSTWSDDYKKLSAEFADYRASSFPRPSVDGLNFLLQLVENLSVSTTSIDSRTHEELAEAIGLTEERLLECSHPNPQRAALMVFSRLYPSYRDRADLIGIKEFGKKKSKLVDDIFVFARRCNPTVIYSMEKMREAIASSIRQAKHQLVRLENMDLQLAAIDNHNFGDGDVENEFNNNDFDDRMDE